MLEKVVKLTLINNNMVNSVTFRPKICKIPFLLILVQHQPELTVRINLWMGIDILIQNKHVC